MSDETMRCENDPCEAEATHLAMLVQGEKR